jgi:UDP-N-acetylglucosamine 2-epimerase
MLKIATIVGARPQFIKIAAVSRRLRRDAEEVLIHTGQHYDNNLSNIFFEELDIPQPKFNLGIGSGSHGHQTGQMMAKIEEVLIDEKPDWVLVYGDTNSTLAGALAAVKLHIKIAHIEAGLRSYNRLMPEEINRVLTDHVSDLLFCPSDVAVSNLAKEGITEGVINVGDVMVDSLLFASEKAKGSSNIEEAYGVMPGKYLLATLHRAENTDVSHRLSNILEAFSFINTPILFPMHPRTRKAISEFGFDEKLSNPLINIIQPVGYLDMVLVEQSARMILTDSGGIQKEAYVLKVPCITLRDETEWVETVQTGWNILVGADIHQIVDAVKNFQEPADHPQLYGDGNAGQRIIDHILNYQS